MSDSILKIVEAIEKGEPFNISTLLSLTIEELVETPIECLKDTSLAALIVCSFLSDLKVCEDHLGDVFSSWSKKLLENKDPKVQFAWKQMVSVALWNDSLPLFKSISSALTSDDVFFDVFGSSPLSNVTQMKNQKASLLKAIKRFLPYGGLWKKTAEMNLIDIGVEHGCCECISEILKRSDSSREGVISAIRARMKSGKNVQPRVEALFDSLTQTESEKREEGDDDDVGDSVDAVNGLFPPPEYHEEVYHYGGYTQKVLALPRQFAQIVIGEIVWRGATALCEWIVGEGAEAPFVVSGSSVAEVGAGCGLCGILCKQLGAKRVLLTDYEPHVMALLERNAALNGLDSKNDVRSVDWLQPLPHELEGAFTAVIGSDIIYCRALCPGLFLTVSHMLSPGGIFAMVNGRARFGKAADLAISDAEAAGLKLLSQTTMDDGWQILSLYKKQ